MFDSITSNVSTCFDASPIALMLTNTLLVQFKSIVDSLLTWIESFYQELKMVYHSSPKDTWLIFFSCIRTYFKALRNESSNPNSFQYGFKTDRSGAYLWDFS